MDNTSPGVRMGAVLWLPIPILFGWMPSFLRPATILPKFWSVGLPYPKKFPGVGQSKEQPPEKISDGLPSLPQAPKLCLGARGIRTRYQKPFEGRPPVALLRPFLSSDALILNS